MASAVTIICPRCKEEIPVEEAFSHQIAERLERDYKEKLAEKDKESAEEQEKFQKELTEKVQDKLRRETELAIRDKANEAEELRKQNKEMQNQMLDLTKLVRELRRGVEEKDLEYQKKLIEFQGKISEETRKKADEEYRLKQLENDKKMADLRAANDELRRKLEQGSQQTQGEVQELLLEESLRKEFPQDEISPVAKGARGGDVVQKVHDKNGRECGAILWESKQTKAWSDGWVMKLKEDQRAAGADLAVIISSVLPQKIKRSGFYQGVWVTDLDGVMGMCWAMRFHLIQASNIRQAAEATGEKKDDLYKYVTSVQFQHRVGAMMDAYQVLLEDMDREKRWFSSKWAKQEKSVRMLMEQTGSIHGELAGIIGTALPPVKNLELGDGQEELPGEDG